MNPEQRRIWLVIKADRFATNLEIAKRAKLGKMSRQAVQQKIQAMAASGFIDVVLPPKRELIARDVLPTTQLS